MKKLEKYQEQSTADKRTVTKLINEVIDELPPVCGIHFIGVKITDETIQVACINTTVMENPFVRIPLNNWWMYDAKKIENEYDIEVERMRILEAKNFN